MIILINATISSYRVSMSLYVHTDHSSLASISNATASLTHGCHPSFSDALLQLLPKYVFQPRSPYFYTIWVIYTITQLPKISPWLLCLSLRLRKCFAGVVLSLWITFTTQLKNLSGLYRVPSLDYLWLLFPYIIRKILHCINWESLDPWLLFSFSHIWWLSMYQCTSIAGGTERRLEGSSCHLMKEEKMLYIAVLLQGAGKYGRRRLFGLQVISLQLFGWACSLFIRQLRKSWILLYSHHRVYPVTQFLL